MWNKLIAVIDNEKVPDYQKEKARLLLDQLNKAGGKELMKNEIECFLYRVKGYCKTLGGTPIVSSMSEAEEVIDEHLRLFPNPQFRWLGPSDAGLAVMRKQGVPPYLLNCMSSGTNIISSFNTFSVRTKPRFVLRHYLQDCTVSGMLVKLPEGELNKKDYDSVKNKLEKIGGKWNTKQQGFLFEQDPTLLIQRLVDGESVNIKKEFQFFATPEALAKRLVELADLKKSDIVLEPSAGDGAILKQISGFNVNTIEAIELMPLNRKKLSLYTLIGDDFLKYDTSLDDPYHTKIIANPPFSKGQDVKHVTHMYKVLRPGGRIVSIMSTQWQDKNDKRSKEFRAFLEEVNAEVIEVEAGVFKESGTNVPTVIVVIDKS